jgi:hypothetical protein
MLYKQLQRITELDKQIQDMHIRLAEYYRERASLTAGTEAPATAKLPEVTPAVDPKSIYVQLKAAWPTLPAYKTLSKRLAEAATTIDKLVTNNHQLANNLTVVAVPPQPQINKIITDSNRYLFTEGYTAPTAKRSWGLIIVTAANFALSVDQLSDSLGKHEFTYKQFDCRALGVREAIAADHQGLEITTDNNWTLLLSDAVDAQHIPCVTKQGDQLIFDIDDARYLLGNNYLQPAIAVN